MSGLLDCLSLFQIADLHLRLFAGMQPLPDADVV